MTDLITRLSKLDAPDREVDAEIAFATGHFDYKLKYGFENCRIERGQNRTNDWVEVFVKDKGTLIYSEPYPRFTASVDAAIALAERVLPESVARRLIIFNSSPAKAGFDGTPERGKLFYYEAATPAIAACIALLRAKEASK